MLSRRHALALSAAAMAPALAHAQATPADAPTMKTQLTFTPPPGAADCHVHVIPDQAQFPMSGARVYTPPTATAEQLLALQHALHLDHVVIVTPSVYGADNSATLAGMKQLGPARARGIAVIDAKTTAAEMDAMAAAGIRGIRINLEQAGVTDPEASGRMLDAMVERVAGRPWHLQMYSRLSVIAPLRAKFAALPIPVVFDHFAGAEARLGPQQPGFDVVLDLVKSGKAYVKLSGAYRSSTAAPGYADMMPFARALIAANPERLVYGSDWPHPDSARIPGRAATDIAPPLAVDDARLLNLIAEWAPDSETRQKILVDNPRRLYGFGGPV